MSVWEYKPFSISSLRRFLLPETVLYAVTFCMKRIKTNRLIIRNNLIIEPLLLLYTSELVRLQHFCENRQPVALSFKIDGIMQKIDV